MSLQICGSTTPVSIVIQIIFCFNGTQVALTGTPSGGTFAGVGVANNMFNPMGLNEGSYVITYTVPDPNCNAIMLNTQSTIQLTEFNASLNSSDTDNVICSGDLVTLTAANGASL